MIGSVLIAIATGCANFQVQQTYSEGGITYTNFAKGNFLFAKTTLEKIDIITKTKTTSKLIGAKNAELTGDAATIQVLTDALIQAAAKAATK